MTPDESTYSIVSHKGPELPDRYWPLILSSWMKTLRAGNDMYRLVEPEAYYRAYSAFIPRRLRDPKVMVKLAVLSDDDDVVLGYSVHDGSQLDYWYVKKDYRTTGIGRRLLPPDLQVVSHVTKTWLMIWSKARYKHIKFNPFG